MSTTGDAHYVTGEIEESIRAIKESYKDGVMDSERNTRRRDRCHAGPHRRRREADLKNTSARILSPAPVGANCRWSMEKSTAIRIECIHCDTGAGDGVFGDATEAEHAGWTDVCLQKESDAVSSFQWGTHWGLCPECNEEWAGG